MTGADSESGRVLVLAENENDLDELAVLLGSEGYAILAATTVPVGLQLLRETGADIVLVDLASPKDSCFEVCRHITAIADIPIILISAEHDEVGVASILEQCASDYVTKPVRARELVARVRAVLRRTLVDSASSTGVTSDEKETAEALVVVGPMQLDPSSRRLVVSGELVAVSRRDFDLLLFLASPPGRLRTREELMDRIWSDRELADTRSLDKSIRRLRAKIEPSPKKPRYLITIHGVGFRLDSPALSPTP